MMFFKNQDGLRRPSCGVLASCGALEKTSANNFAEFFSFDLFSFKSGVSASETDHAATVRQFLPMLADDCF